MANEGIPLGGQFPSRRVARTAFNDLLGDAASELGVDRRTLFGKQAERIFSDSLNSQDITDGFKQAGLYYDPNEEEFGDDSAFQKDVVSWDIPTSSTNYSRPRTVAAAYAPNAEDPNNGTMTVVFRDGTFYNYYQVSPSEWQSFHASFSKGKPWLNKRNKNQAGDGLFINKPRGIANVSEIPPEIREALYRVARTVQQKRKPKPGRTSQNAPMYLGGKPAGSMAVQNQLLSASRKKQTQQPIRATSSRGTRKAS